MHKFIYHNSLSPDEELLAEIRKKLWGEPDCNRMYRFSGGWKQVSKGANPIYYLGTIFIWNFQKRESWYSIIFLIHVDMCLYKSPNWKHNFRICWILIITREINIIMIPIFNYLVFSYSGLKLFDAKYRQNHESKPLHR